MFKTTRTTATTTTIQSNWLQLNDCSIKHSNANFITLKIVEFTHLNRKLFLVKSLSLSLFIFQMPKYEQQIMCDELRFRTVNKKR